jgi:hypothetical protein
METTKYNVLAYIGIGTFLLIGIIVAVGYIKGDGATGIELNKTIIGDKEKVYDNLTSTFTINNATGSKVEILSGKLDTPKDNPVSWQDGYQRVAQFTCNAKNITYCIPKVIELYDLNDNNKSIVRQIDYKYLSLGTKRVDEKYCNNVTKCTDFHYVDEWLPYTGGLQLNESITIGLFTTVQRGDKIEWIPTFTVEKTDVVVNEWATYTDVSVLVNSVVSGNAGGVSLTALRDGSTATWAAYSNADTIPWNLGYIFPNATTISKIRWYNFKTQELSRHFKIEYSVNGVDTWTKLPITGWEDNATQNNTDEAQAGNGNDWQTVTFTGVSAKGFRVNVTDYWYVGDANAGIAELQMYTSVSYCNISGYALDSGGSPISGANVIIIKQTGNSLVGNATSQATGYWSKNVENDTGFYTVMGYYNNSLTGAIKPFISSNCSA